MANRRNEVTKARHRRDKLGPVDRMLLDDCPLFSGKRLLLREHAGVFLIDLADIVKQRSMSDVFDLPLGESDGPRNHG